MSLEMPKRKWNLTPDLKKRVEEIRGEIEKDREKFENTPRPCPTHPGKHGNFIRRVGAYMRSWAIFKCEEGHEFQVSSRAKAQD